MRICIFGASSETVDEIYFTETEKLAHTLAKAGHSLVFGAGKYGMMGAAARGFAAEGAHITGVAPKFFIPMNVLFDGCDEMINHDTMRERKKYMEENSDAFIVTPGGIGTFDELFEVLSLLQLGRMDKPLIIYNINGFYDPLIAWLRKCSDENFIKEHALLKFEVTADAEEVLNLLNK